MRGGDKKVVQRRQLVHDQAVVVHRHCQHARRAQAEGVACVRVAGLFETDTGAGMEQTFGQQVVGVLRADGDEDLVGQREHAARRQQTQADLLDELRNVVGFEVGRPARLPRARQGAHDALAEVLGREELGVVLAVDKGIGVVAPAHRLGQHGLARQGAVQAMPPIRGAARRCDGHRVGRRRGSGRKLRGATGVCDVDAAARPRLQKALVDELIVGGGDRVSAQAQQPRQFARRRHRHASGQPALQQRLDYGLAQPGLERQRGAGLEREQPLPLDAAGPCRPALPRLLRHLPSALRT